MVLCRAAVSVVAWVRSPLIAGWWRALAAGGRADCQSGWPTLAWRQLLGVSLPQLQHRPAASACGSSPCERAPFRFRGGSPPGVPELDGKRLWTMHFHGRALAVAPVVVAAVAAVLAPEVRRRKLGHHRVRRRTSSALRSECPCSWQQ